ncbi:hypothetical protein C3F09_10105 [candidate division GN15 bacterium]|uniref:Uncharacterized protein n=1 Tax=candidate division GN15 bacterium TaxID=2072418 RepID=A0A855WWY7_9BACT|nr:MAG: hypothetical protein C3F09_10105 [candidate division GN15 bacterium]
MMDFGTIIAGLLTLAILTFLYRDNPIYKLAEYLLVGVAVGYALVIAWKSAMVDLLFTPLFGQGDWSLLLPLILGLMMFGRFHARTSFISRVPLAVLIGSGAGAAVPAMLGPRILTQVSGSVTPLVGTDGLPNWSGLIVIVGVLSTLAYFFFSREHRGSLGVASKVGTWFLMIFFGTTFGYTVMSRMSTFIGRAEFLLTDFLHLTR